MTKPPTFKPGKPAHVSTQTQVRTQPAVYRPQPVPRVLQRQTAATAVAPRAAAVPIHRRPALAKVLQPKVAIQRQLPGRSNAVIQCMGAAEQQLIRQWVANSADDYLSDVPATRVDDAPMSTAVRFRWFKLSLGGTAYMAGLNIHYGGGFGALWVKNLTSQETMEFHPHMAPQHGLPAALVTRIKNNHEGLVSAAILAKI